MSEQFKHEAHPSKVRDGLSRSDNDSLPPLPDEQDVVALIKKMQQQLVFLEKKIDILISQSQARPSGEKYFPKSFRPFGHPHRSYDKGRDNASRESDSGQGRHFEKRFGGENRGFNQKKKPFPYRRKSRG